MKRKSFFFTVLTILLFVGFSFAQGAYLKLGDIKGESTDANHKDWINIESVSYAMGQPKTATTGAVRRRAAVALQDLVVTKSIDKSSPKLMEICAKGQVIPKLELELTSSNNRVYYKVTLNNVRVSSISTNTNCNPNCTLVEEVAFNYAKITWEYHDSSGQRTVASYDARSGN